MSSQPITDEEAVAAADKEMEARANRAKELLSQRYVGLKRQQVRYVALAQFNPVRFQSISEAAACIILETHAASPDSPFPSCHNA